MSLSQILSPSTGDSYNLYCNSITTAGGGGVVTGSAPVTLTLGSATPQNITVTYTIVGNIACVHIPTTLVNGTGTFFGSGISGFPPILQGVLSNLTILWVQSGGSPDILSITVGGASWNFNSISGPPSSTFGLDGPTTVTYALA